MATALRLALGILQGRGGISLLGNEDEPIFRGHVLPDINFPASSQQIKCNSLYLSINVILYLRTKCKTLYKVRQVKIFVQSANCTFGEQLQNTNAPLIT